MTFLSLPSSSSPSHHLPLIAPACPLSPFPMSPFPTLQVRFCNLPLASRVIFNVSYKDGTPVGWAGVNVFTAQQVLRSGTLVLPLWPGKLTPENILRITNLANTHAHPDGVPSLVITLHTFEKTVVRLGPSSHMLVSRSYERPHHPGGMPLHDSDGVPNADYIALRATVGEYASVRDRVAHLVRQDPLYKLTPDDAALLWRCRDFMTGASHADQSCCDACARVAALFSKWCLIAHRLHFSSYSLRPSIPPALSVCLSICLSTA